MAKKNQQDSPEAPTGPRGGTTSVYTRKGTNEVMVKKTAYLTEGELRALKLASMDTKRSENDILRDALRAHLGLDK